MRFAVRTDEGRYMVIEGTPVGWADTEAEAARLASESAQWVHYWERFAPASDITITKCGRTVPYGNSELIVLWSEKPATCPDCLAMVPA